MSALEAVTSNRARDRIAELMIASNPMVAPPMGTDLRVFEPALEGRNVRGYARLAAGGKVRVTDFESGHLDFARWRSRSLRLYAACHPR
jgi:hypothetical protein